MSKHTVAVVRYEAPGASVRRVVELSGGLEKLPAGGKVFIKPNVVFWTKAVTFPKWGVITTTRVIEDMVVLLKERGIDDITIGEGIVTMKPKDLETPAHAFETLGYGELSKRYGVKVVNVFERPFEKVELGEGVELNFNTDILHSDFVVDIPVLKTHNQAKVTLGIKNLKGTIDIKSRKRCHSADPDRDLNFMIARLADKLPPIFAILDGIYTNERGPSFDGKIKRSNILVASPDVLSADMAGARLLGFPPSDVPYLVHAAKNQGRPIDMSDVDVVGEDIDDLARRYTYDFTYAETEDGELPLPLARQGLRGISYRKFDLTMCTYCAGFNGLVLSTIRNAWKGEAWDDVEILNGKMMAPTPGKKKTILLGKCMYQAHKDNSDIQEMIAVKGCPPQGDQVLKALRAAGIDADSTLFDNMDQLPGFFMAQYKDRPEFDEAFFRAS
ncbi:MAG: DUF362 domain-containing protein [Deltaproteobacteria bacterium]|nr:DUF362 domain-containing protein [Deltaproteobacteria bacterium]MBW1818151.1 DUF362 domain-containing protein [Deltaproteobacteria bacterium]